MDGASMFNSTDIRNSSNLHNCTSSALLHGGNLHPRLVHRLLPQRHLVVASGYRQDISCHGPADAPHGRIESPQQFRLPRAVAVVLAPYVNRTVLRAGGNDVVGDAPIRRPCHVAHPVCENGLLSRVSRVHECAAFSPLWGDKLDLDSSTHDPPSPPSTHRQMRTILSQDPVTSLRTTSPSSFTDDETLKGAHDTELQPRESFRKCLTFLERR